MVWHLNLDGVKMYYDTISENYPICSRIYSIILKDKSLSCHVVEYSFWFPKRLSSKEMFQVAEWCDENLKDDYLVGVNASGFEDESDAMAFRLRWT